MNHLDSMWKLLGIYPGSSMLAVGLAYLPETDPGLQTIYMDGRVSASATRPTQSWSNGCQNHSLEPYAHGLTQADGISTPLTLARGCIYPVLRAASR
jgi:hypothetical protein